ncbi:MAG TPA: carbohydrate ABC transporter permease [Actinospica sp.]|nr:carbohydrate ABC transporter permease [Actinospica sp.]
MSSTTQDAPHAGHKPAGGAPLRSARRLGGAWRGWSAVRKALAILLGLAFVFPFYWTFVISTSNPGGFYRFPPELIPEWNWSNWSRAWNEAPWVRFFLNTVFIASATVLLCLVTSVLAGFAFGVLRFRGKKFLTLLVLSVLMMPGTVLIIPDYVLATDIHWVNTYWIQIVPWGASVFGIFLVRQFFVTMPQEILDAASVDGAGRLRVLWHIGVPAVRPALALIAINVFMTSWNSFLWPEIMTNSTNVQPVEVGLSGFASDVGTDIPGLAAAATFTTLPLIVFFLLLQRHFIRGALSAAGSVK